MSGSSGADSGASNTSSLLSSCCISILGRPHLPPESKNSAGLPPAVTSHPQGCTSSMKNPDHIYPISSLPQGSGLLCPESHRPQHLQPGQTSSLAHPSPLPLLRVLSGLHGGQPASWTVPEGPALSESHPFTVKSRLS